MSTMMRIQTIEMTTVPDAYIKRSLCFPPCLPNLFQECFLLILFRNQQQQNIQGQYLLADLAGILLFHLRPTVSPDLICGVEYIKSRYVGGGHLQANPSRDPNLFSSF